MSANPITVDQLARLYEDGLSLNKIAGHTGISASTVARKLKRNRIQLRSACLARGTKLREPSAALQDPAIIDQLAELYHQGLSVNTIAARIGIAAGTVSNRLRRQGIELRQTNPALKNPNLAAQLARLYKKGLSVRKIATSIGIPASTVRDRLKRRGVKTREHTFRYPDIQTAKIVRAYVAGSSPTQIAKRHRISRPTVEYRLKLSGCELRRQKRKVLQMPVSEIIKLYNDDKLSMPAIARRFDVSVDQVWRRLNNAGVQLRSRTQHLAELNRKLNEAERILAGTRKGASQDGPRRRPGRTRKDAVRTRVSQLKQLGKSWGQIRIIMNDETGEKLTKDAYRTLLRPPKKTRQR